VRVVLLVCVATGLEGARLEAALGGASGTLAGRRVELVETGVGPVNAAYALTRRLVQARPERIVVCGVGGAYPGAGLGLTEVACAETETYGDLGAESEEGFLDMERLGFPVVPGAAPLFNRLPLDLFPCARRLAFVTRSTCTGTEATAREIAARTGGAVESMEGAAIVHVARREGIPVGEIRGISNPVGRRERAGWKVAEAAAAAQEALLAWIGEGAC